MCVEWEEVPSAFRFNETADPLFGWIWCPHVTLADKPRTRPPQRFPEPVPGIGLIPVPVAALPERRNATFREGGP